MTMKPPRNPHLAIEFEMKTNTRITAMPMPIRIANIFSHVRPPKLPSSIAIARRSFVGVARVYDAAGSEAGATRRSMLVETRPMTIVGTIVRKR